MSKAILVIVLCGAAIAARAQPVAAPSPTFGRPLVCDAPVGTPTLLSEAGRGFATSVADGQWASQFMASNGYPAALPASAQAREAALAAAGLLRRGHIVAAKMAQDEANEKIRAYNASAFSRNFESVLTVVTQPVAHASYPEAVRADGETRGAGRAAGTHGVDLEESSGALARIIARAEIAKKAMGDHYRNPAIRYYLLAHGFRDEVALAAASAAVCRLKPNAQLKSRLDTSARFMAMPAAGQPAGAAK